LPHVVVGFRHDICAFDEAVRSLSAMSVTSPPVEGSPERIGRQALTSQIKTLGQRYAVHSGLFVVALLFLLAGRLDLSWDGLQLGLPPVQPQIAVPTLAPLVDEGVSLQAPASVLTPVPETAFSRLAIPRTYEPALPTHDFVQHVVERGDTPNSVAETYGIEPATLLWGNPDLSDEAQLLRVGITLTILPTNGVLHTVVASDTVELLAEMYGVDPKAIIEYEDNHLEQWPYRPVPGTQIFVPGGEKQFLVWTYTPNSPRVQASTSSYYNGPIVYAGVGRFIWPTDGWRITQYYWWAHRAIDIGVAVGHPVYASDGGTVIYAGWSTVGYGNHIVLDHGNGFQTLYAHLSAIYVASGQFVGQGTVIGASGNTGNSSGPHLHFEIRYGGSLLNPLDYLWQ
jgi:murein DD-endopeptidase MepM/ murein hydrolase activator NlpD